MRIGKVQSVDLRDLWKNEASDFTSWLAANLDSLSEALDLELEFIEQEKRVDDSRFSIDIWAEDEEGTVIIENQLERTDHSHLGQVITYAANMDAHSVIWISKDPRQEHINAVNWLNEFVNKRFYLVQVAAIRIGTSDPAPQFNVVCRPSREMKVIGKSKRVMDDVIHARRSRRMASDTLIVPARKEGFDRVFIGENQWYSIRIRKERIPQIKYIAAYQVAPISAVTHIAQVKEIVPSDEIPGKYKVLFKGPAKPITPIPLGSGTNIQGPTYCEMSRLTESKNLAEAISIDEYQQDDSEAA